MGTRIWYLLHSSFPLLFRLEFRSLGNRFRFCWGQIAQATSQTKSGWVVREGKGIPVLILVSVLCSVQFKMGKYCLFPIILKGSGPKIQVSLLLGKNAGSYMQVLGVDNQEIRNFFHFNDLYFIDMSVLYQRNSTLAISRLKHFGTNTNIVVESPW